MNGPNSTTAPQTKKTIEALWRLEKIILDTLDFTDVVQKTVDSILTELGYLQLGYRIVVLALINNESQELQRVSISQTDEARKALEVTPVPFKDIVIPLSAKDNFCIKAVIENKPFVTQDWKDILMPPYSSVQDARQVQRIVGIKTSMIYPVTYHNEARGIMIFSMVKDETEVSEDEKDLIRGLTDVVGLAVQNSRLYSRLEKTTDLLKDANKRLEELDKLKDEFVSLASHELRTPMTAVKSYLWMALAGKGGELTEKQKYYLDRAYQSTDRLIRLVGDMLNISRIESGRISMEYQETNITALITDVLTELKPKIDESNVTLEFSPIPTLPTVIADTDKIKEVIINIVGNAIKFTPAGGKITVSTETHDTLVVTHVTDTGSGISQEDIGKLFQKFGLIKGSYATNKNAAQGTGLGLYICKSIVELLGGTIWAQSAGSGKGSTFSFSLKVYDAKEMERMKTAHAGVEGIGLIHRMV